MGAGRVSRKGGGALGEAGGGALGGAGGARGGRSTVEAASLVAERRRRLRP